MDPVAKHQGNWGIEGMEEKTHSGDELSGQLKVWTFTQGSCYIASWVGGWVDPYVHGKVGADEK